MMNPVPWLQMTNMISYQGLVRTFLSPRLPIGMPMQKDNADFTDLINHSMKRLMLSKEFANIYNKWFFEPIMPQGITLNWPMPPELKQSLSSTALYSYSHAPCSEDNGQP